MGTGGYRTAEPKWDQTEAAMREKGIIPAGDSMPHRARNFLLGNGVEYDMETGELTHDEKKQNSIPQKALVQAIAKV